MFFSNSILNFVSNRSFHNNNNNRLMNGNYKKYIFYILFIAIIALFKRVKATTEYEPAEEITSIRYQVAKFKFEEVSGVYAIAFWILLGSLAKIGLFFIIKNKLI